MAEKEIEVTVKSSKKLKEDSAIVSKATLDELGAKSREDIELITPERSWTVTVDVGDIPAGEVHVSPEVLTMRLAVDEGTKVHAVRIVPTAEEEYVPPP
ncbi:MAG: hypothetical protein ACE5OY_00255 [Candidatus Bathyarchaeia archaeon]